MLKVAGFNAGLKVAAAALYHSAYKLHHAIFLRPGKPLMHARLIVVGSFLAGGAGKTPFCAWLAEFLKSESSDKPIRIAILCHSKASDEAKMLREMLPFAKVVATGNRYKTAHQLDSEFDYIICDDGFEDSRLTGAITIRLDWGKAPQRIRDLIPAGPFRSLESDHGSPALTLRCNPALTLRCTPATALKNAPAHNSNAPTHDRDEIERYDSDEIERPDCDIRFSIDPALANELRKPNETPSSALTNELRKPNETPSSALTLVCGLGNGQRFADDLAKIGIAPAKTVFRRDHDPKFEKIILSILNHGESAIVSAKDFARLSPETAKNPHIFVAKQKTEVLTSAQNAIKSAITATSATSPS